MSRLFEEIRHVDLNPPMLYLLTRAAQQAFGANEIATRLPSVLAFFGASFLVAGFLANRVGWLWAWAAVTLFWWSDFFWYSTEARPYSLLLFFFALTLFSRDLARGAVRKRWALLGVFLGSCGMILTHVLAPFTLAAFGAAELVRLWKRRVTDWTMWLALFAPLAIFPFQLFLIRTVTRGTFPAMFQASASKAAAFYQSVFLGTSLLVGLAAVIAFAVRPRQKYRGSRPGRFALEDAALLAALCVSPLLVNLALMRNHGPFFDRYCITAALAILTGAIIIMAHAARFSRFAGLAVVILFAGSTVNAKFLEPLTRLRATRPLTNKLESVSPDLPMVMASGLTFLEIDHYSDSKFLSRVYYLTDLPSALKYAHADIFEGLAVEKQYFPIRAQVVPYRTFIAQHRKFLVLGTINYPEDWLLRKLISEGVTVRQAGALRVPYKDKTLYLVDFDAKGIGKAG